EFRRVLFRSIGAFRYNIGGNFAYNKNSVTRFEGKLQQGIVDDGAGGMVWQSNLGDVSAGGINRVLEDYQYNEFYLRQVYRGDGSYFHSDGSVNINGGPTTGMIRTEIGRASCRERVEIAAGAV